MKFIDSFADPVSGESYVIIKHRKKEYNGKAKLHPDDSWSNITGCKYAEMRASIAALKEEYKCAYQSYQQCENFVKSIEQYKNFNAEDPSAKVMYRQLNRRKKDVENKKIFIDYLESELQNMIDRQTLFNIRQQSKQDNPS